MLHIKEQQLLTLLDLASAFVSGKDDCRNYLHDVVYKDNVIKAANGHMLIQIDIDNNTIDDMPIVLPERLLVKSIKDANKVNNITLLAENTYNTGTNYPDFNRLIPSEFKMSSEPVGLNMIYLATAMTALHKACKKISSSKYFGVKLVQTDKNSGNYFQCTIYSALFY